MSLFKIVDDLMRDATIRKRFVADPRALIAEYNLSNRERRILLTMNKRLVKDYVPQQMHDEVRDFIFSPGEFLPSGDEFLSEFGGLDPQYPTPEPGIFRYRINPPFKYEVGPPVPPTNPPTTVVHRGFSLAVVNTSDSKAIELTVFGQSFVDAELQLVRTRDSAQALVTNPMIMGTLRNSIVRGVIYAPGSAVPGGALPWTLGDLYQVTIVNNPSLPPPPPPNPLRTVHTALPLLEVLQ